MTHVLDAGQMKQHDKRVVRPATIHRAKKFAIVLSEGFSLMHAARLAEAFGLVNELVKPYADRAITTNWIFCHPAEVSFCRHPACPCGPALRTDLIYPDFADFLWSVVLVVQVPG